MTTRPADWAPSVSTSSCCIARRTRRRQRARRRASQDPPVDRLLLECAILPFYDTIRFRLLDEAEAGTDAPVPDLLEEVVRQVLRSVVHPQRQPAGDIGTNGRQERLIREGWGWTAARGDVTRLSSRSSPRPPRRQREPVLRGAGTFPQQLVLHGQLADVALGRVQGRDGRFTHVPLQPELQPRQGPLLPVLQALDLHPHLTRHRVERLAAQEPQHDIPFAARAPPLPRRQGPRPNRPGVGTDSGRPPSAPTQLPSPSLTEPFPPPPWTLDSPLIRVQENWRRLIFIGFLWREQLDAVGRRSMAWLAR